VRCREGSRFPEVTNYHRRPLNAAGFAGFAFIPAFTSVVVVCAVPAISVWRFFQPVVAVVSAAFWFTAYMWIA
jgi:hypothetical protein